QLRQPDQRSTDDQNTQPEPQKQLDVEAHLLLPGSGGPAERVLVTDAAQRLDAVETVGAGTELAAEVADVGVDAAIEGRKRPVQHRAHQLVASDNVACVSEQRFEQIELDGRQFYRLAAATNDACCLVHRQVVDNQIPGYTPHRAH